MSRPYKIQRFRGGYAIKWTDEDGKPHRNQLAATDPINAEIEARKRWQLAQRGEWTVGRIVPTYIEARERDGIETTQRQRDAWKAMKPFWNDIQPRDIDDELCKRYQLWRGRSVATVRYELTTMSAALRLAKRERFIDDAPFVWRPTPTPHKTRHLTRAEFRLFFEHVIAPHARLFMVLGLATVARPSAILELQWKQIDFESGLIDLNAPGRTQTRKRRPVVPIADYARPILEEAHATRIVEAVIERGGEPIKSIKKAFQAASKRSGIKATPYTLRHTGAVWRAEDGIPMSELAQLMGHNSSVTTEMHYARYSPQYLRKAANAGAW